MILSSAPLISVPLAARHTPGAFLTRQRRTRMIGAAA
jgi:hypothetical protein